MTEHKNLGSLVSLSDPVQDTICQVVTGLIVPYRPPICSKDFQLSYVSGGHLLTILEKQ